MAGEEAGAAAENDKLEQIQPPRWSPTAGSRCTCVESVLSKAADGSFFSVLVAALADASIFFKICPRVGGCIAAATGAALARLPPPASGPGWMVWRRRCPRAQFTFLSK